MQPFYGGSHQAFIDGWISRSRHQWDTIHLPARHWKWRMRHSAIEFARRIDQCWRRGQRWDVILTTDMCNVAELKGLIRTPARCCPVLCYFHENQFAYPNQFPRDRDEHFLFTNLVTALAADRCWFNSKFNQDSLVTAIADRCQRWPDFPPTDAVESILGRSCIMPPPVDSPPGAEDWQPPTDKPLHLVWAARWEHDKNPALLLQILRGLRHAAVPFRIDIIGPSFRQEPDEFSVIGREFSAEIGHWGYQETRTRFWETLRAADVILSTADHEFFGLSVVEALTCGLQAVLPNRLSYPEIAATLGRGIQLYELAADAVQLLAEAANDLPRLRTREFRRQTAQQAIQRYGWQSRLSLLDQGIDQLRAPAPAEDL